MGKEELDKIVLFAGSLDELNTYIKEKYGDKEELEFKVASGFYSSTGFVLNPLKRALQELKDKGYDGLIHVNEHSFNGGPFTFFLPVMYYTGLPIKKIRQ